MSLPKSLCTLGLLGMSVLAAHDTTLYGPVLPLEHVQNSPDATAMVSTGSHLYTASAGRLAVYNLENPLKPRFIKEIKGFKGGRQMAWQNDYLYLTARDYGLWIFDIKDRENPRLAGHFDSTELATGIAVSGNIAYVAHRVYGTQILDITNPLVPRHVATVRTREAQTVLANGKLIFLGDWGSGELTIASVDNPRQPQILAKVSLDGFGDGVDVSGNLCIASTGHHSKKLGGAKSPEAFGMGHGIELIDISQPEKPVTLSVFKFPKFYWLGNDFWTVRICDNTAFAVDTHNGFFMVDITDRTAPKPLGHAVLPAAQTYNPKDGKKYPINDCATSVALGDGCVYVTGLHSGLYVIPTPGKARFLKPMPPQVTLPPEGPLPQIKGLKNYDISDRVQVRRAAIYDKADLAFFACSQAGVKVCQLLENDLKVIQTLPVACAYDVTIHQDRLFVAAGQDGILIYDILPDKSIVLRKKFKQRGRGEWAQVVHIYKNGTLLAWHGRGSKFFIVDIQDIDNPKPIFMHSNVGLLYNDNLIDTDIDGIIASVHGHATDLIDLNGPTPKVLSSELSKTRNNHNSCAFVAFNGKALTGNGNQLFVFDPKTFEQDTVLKKITAAFQGFTAMPTRDGNSVVWVNRATGTITTVDLSDLEHPKQLADRSWTNLPCIPDRAVFWHHRLIIPGGPEGVYIEQYKQP